MFYWKRRGCMVVVLGLAVVLCGRVYAAQEASAPEPDAGQHAIKTVFVILLENHNWTKDGSLDIKGNTQAPYINWNLVPMASHANNYWNPPHTHPSLPNYLWLEAGSDFGIHNDGSAYRYHQSTHDHLVSLLDRAHISWKAYEENISGKQCPLSHWHDPFVFFNDVTNDNNLYSAKCIAHVRPFAELKKDLEQDHVARYNFIVPNVCDDMHNPCHGESRISGGDDWLAKNVPDILRSHAYRSGGALFILWDEALRGDGPVPLIVLSPFAKGNGYSNNIHYTHGSTLRTLQEIFGVGPLMRDAAKQTDLRDLFSVFP